MLVSMRYPFHVLSLGEIGIPILKLDSQDLVGQSVLKILGPNTDHAMFVSAVLGVANLKSVRLQFIVYDRYGEERRAIVSFCPFLRLNCVFCCQVTIEASEAITLDDTFDETNCPLALLAAESPHCVKYVNDDFLTKFRCTRLQTVGVAFTRFQGSDQTSWIPLLEAALRGKIARDKVHTFTSFSPAEDDVICVPAVESLNGVIRYILVLFSPSSEPHPPHAASRPDPGLQLQLSHTSPNSVTICSAPALPPLSCRVLSIRPTTTAWPAHCFKLSSASGYAQSLQSQHPQSDHAQAPLENPRSKPERADSPPRPDSDGPPAVILPRRSLEPARTAVVVTPALLGTLAGLPLPRAAAAVGVSTTAFKRACRKLGVTRWAYRRGAGRRSGRGGDEEARHHPSDAGAGEPAACAPPPPPPSPPSPPPPNIAALATLRAGCGATRLLPLPLYEPLDAMPTGPGRPARPTPEYLARSLGTAQIPDWLPIWLAAVTASQMLP